MQRNHHQQPQQRRRSSGSSERPPRRRSLLSRSRSRSAPFREVSASLTVATIKSILGRIHPFCEEEERLVCDRLCSTISALETAMLEEVLLFLKGKLASKDIPNDLVADMHSCIGLLQDQLGSPDQGIRSMMNALWIRRKISGEAEGDVAIALTEHRLGVIYAKLGLYEDAISLMEEAYHSYGLSHLKPDHPLYVQAEESLREFRLKHYKLKMVARTGTGHGGNLSRIGEEGSSLSTKSTPGNRVVVVF